MKSRIQIDFTEVENQGLQPVIAVTLESSDDPRDGLLRTFFQQLGHESNWLRVSFDHHIITDPSRKEIKSFIRIYPLKPSEMKEESAEMTIRLKDKDRNNYSPLL